MKRSTESGCMKNEVRKRSEVEEKSGGGVEKEEEERRMRK